MSMKPSGLWHGLDGNWSTFELSLGPANETSQPTELWQSFYMLVSTSSHQLKVPYSAYCSNLSNPWAPDCGRLRGVREFQGSPGIGYQPLKSETWNPETQEDIVIFLFHPDEIRNQTDWYSVGHGHYFPGWGKPVKVEEADPEKGELMGSFGMNAVVDIWQPASSPSSFMKSITSGTWHQLAYAYTAGASYRNEPASLTIGHYNSSLMSPGARSFPFSPDHDLKVHLSHVETSKTLQSEKPTTLALDIDLVLDSSAPYFQFPATICSEFEKAFGLQYQPDTGLFFVNSTTRAKLQRLNPNLTLTFVGGTEDNGYKKSDMEIILPYASFDLEIRTTPSSLPKAYFPLKVTPENDIGVLGRAFFQEAYLIVNHPYRNFTLSQRSFGPVGAHGANLTKIRANMGSVVSGSLAGLVFGTLLFLLFLATVVAIPLFIFYLVPTTIIKYAFDIPRARRLEVRQKELERRWNKIHGG